MRCEGNGNRQKSGHHEETQPKTLVHCPASKFLRERCKFSTGPAKYTLGPSPRAKNFRKLPPTPHLKSTRCISWMHSDKLAAHARRLNLMLLHGPKNKFVRVSSARASLEFVERRSQP